MKLNAYLTAIITLFTSMSYASVNLIWGNDFNNGHLMLNSDESTPLTAGNDGNSGHFLQLIKIISGSDNTHIDFSSSNAVDTTFHELIDFGFIGMPNGSLPDGQFERVANYNNLAVGDNVFVRIWNAPSPDFGNGFAPISNLNFYGNSNILSIPNDPLPEVYFSTTSTTLTAIPEPGTIVLMLVAGAGVLLTARRRRS